MAFHTDRVKNIVPRHPNSETIERDAHGNDLKTVKTFNLGVFEIMNIQEGLDNLDGEKREGMAYLEWVLGSCDNVEITITATYES